MAPQDVAVGGHVVDAVGELVRRGGEVGIEAEDLLGEEPGVEAVGEGEGSQAQDGQAEPHAHAFIRLSTIILNILIIYSIIFYKD